MYPSCNILHTILQNNTEARRWTSGQSADLIQMSRALICIPGGSFVYVSFYKFYKFVTKSVVPCNFTTTMDL